MTFLFFFLCDILVNLLLDMDLVSCLDRQLTSSLLIVWRWSENPSSIFFQHFGSLVAIVKWQHCLGRHIFLNLPLLT